MGTFPLNGYFDNDISCASDLYGIVISLSIVYMYV